ncbi:MAG: hypothetical protein ACREDR_07005, partial [Blastocatellia bacterium]
LPPDFIAAREADLQRVTAVSGSHSQTQSTGSQSIVQIFNQASKPQSTGTGAVVEILTGIADLLT